MTKYVTLDLVIEPKGNYFSMTHNKEEWSSYFLDNITPMYLIWIDHQGNPTRRPEKENEAKRQYDKGQAKELNFVKINFFYEIGKYLVENLEPEDTMKIMGVTRDGRVPFFKEEIYLDIMVQKNKEIENRKALGDSVDKWDQHDLSNMPKESIKHLAYREIGVRFMIKKRELMNGGGNFNSLYPELDGAIHEIWQKEVYKKNIAPFLDGIFQNQI
jgi:hypothetical protein